MEINVRIAIEEDLEEIITIYNQAIKTRISIAYTNEYDCPQSYQKHYICLKIIKNEFYRICQATSR
jgi:hypothetical protein